MAKRVSASNLAAISHRLLEVPLDVQSVTLPDDMVAERCGRNTVWRLIFTDGRKWFMKFCDDLTTFQRETQGLRWAEELASQDDRFMSASIVYSDKKEKVFATEGLPGLTLLDLCKSTFRIDRNPFGKETLKANTRLAVQRLCDWLGQLHRIQLSDTSCLYDHSVSAVSKRVQRKLKKNVNGYSISDLVGISSVEPSNLLGTSNALIFGDVTLGNFFFDGEKIGAIDFEDLGVGPPSRDFKTLELEFQRPFRTITYRSDRYLLQQLSHLSSSAHPIFEFELKLLRLEQLVQSSSSTKREQKRIRDELQQLAMRL